MLTAQQSIRAIALYCDRNGLREYARRIGLDSVQASNVLIRHLKMRSGGQHNENSKAYLDKLVSVFIENDVDQVVIIKRQDVWDIFFLCPV
ncbi:hypothetical protein BKE30_14015 [Alkanindiges hydrocarboniclasticus]|uniref:Uncharacterized protein n=1 Tax=Alkanindiges hydrocarboniclasticus TaxID=1907941 RepID=A0A1S8CRE1_9GAMM|nr:hypothetical protein BKE30_14015 [Alkanindiges hydrocarboniclasticus]